MEVLALLCIALIVGHVVSVWRITQAFERVSAEFKVVALEREESYRQMYTEAPTQDVERDGQEVPGVVKVVPEPVPDVFDYVVDHVR